MIFNKPNDTCNKFEYITYGINNQPVCHQESECKGLIDYDENFYKLNSEGERYLPKIPIVKMLSLEMENWPDVVENSID